jgi:hypothetical protein
MKLLEQAHYVFQPVFGDTYKVVKDRIGDFKDDHVTEHKTVKCYYDSGYDGAIVDQDGDLIMKNF